MRSIAWNILGWLLVMPSTVLATTSVAIETNSVEWLNTSSIQNFGTTLATGDVNHDGYTDIVVGNSGYDGASLSDGGRVYLIYGSSSNWSSSSWTSAVTFTAEAAGDALGTAVALVDIDDDGYDDLLMGATGYGSNGAFYLVYGQASALSSVAVSDSSVIRITGQSGVGYLGDSFAIGDMNGDGRDDLAAGAQFHGSSGLFGPGAAYLVLGQAARFSSGSVSNFDVKYNGLANGDSTGASLVIGNWNGDAYMDLAIGACECNTSDEGTHTGGKVFIIYGSATTGNSQTTVTLASSITLTGEASNDAAGKSLGAADINHDGYDELIIGASTYDATQTDAGAVYIVYGQASQHSSGGLSNYPKLTGSRSFGSLGSAVIAGADFNQDSYEDLIIGAPLADTTSGGQAFIVLGAAGQFTSSSITNAAALLLNSTVTSYQNQLGGALTFGDFNHDGATDITLGAPTTGPQQGATYTLYSIANHLPVTRAPTDDTSDTDADTPDITSEAAFENEVVSIEAQPDGSILVTYSDASTVLYQIFPDETERLTTVRPYQGTGQLLVLNAGGCKLALVNVYTGERLAQTRLRREVCKAKQQHRLLVSNLGKDQKTEIIVISAKEEDVHISVLRLTGQQKLKLLSKTQFAAGATVKPKCTEVKKRKYELQLKNKHCKVIAEVPLEV